MFSESDLPKALSQRLRTQLGTSYSAFIESLHGNAVSSYRINPAKPAHPPGTHTRVPWCEGGFYPGQEVVFALDPAWHAGGYYVQEASSMLIGQAFASRLNSDQPLRVLDLCAAPGGKSTHVLSLLNEHSLLVTNETVRGRTGMLAENITRWGHAASIVTHNDPRDFTRLPHFFDVILVDAPCSGEGLIRRDSGVLDHWSEQNVQHCTVRQQRILDDVLPALAPGGMLIYSTCTMAPNENELQMQALIERHPHMQSTPVDFEQSSGVEEMKIENKSVVMYAYRCLPHRLQGEGFFMSVLLNTDPNTKEIDHRPSKSNTHQSDVLQAASEWMNIENLSVMKLREENYLVPAPLFKSFELLSNNLKVLQVGIQAGRMIKSNLLPSHHMAMSPLLNKNAPATELSLEEALNYLRKNEIKLQGEKTGWMLAKHKGLNLGWMKSIGSRINNYYPTNWRLRMQEKKL